MKRRVSFLSKRKCWKKNRLSKWFPIKGTHCTVVVQHTVMWTNERVPIRNWRRGLFCRFLPLDRMFSGVFFWHVDTPIYRDLIWQPSELGPHGEKRGGEGWVLLLLFIPSAFAFSRLETSAAEAAGAEEEVYWVCVNSSLSFRPQTCQPHHHHYCSNAQILSHRWKCVVSL